MGNRPNLSKGGGGGEGVKHQTISHLFFEGFPESSFVWLLGLQQWSCASHLNFEVDNNGPVLLR
jgi:hypothetical protein